MTRLPRVAIVCPNLASNCLGRAMLLAELLSSDTTVRIVGVQRGAKLWTPALAGRFEIESYPLTHGSRYSPKAVSWLRDVIRDDFVLVSKPLPHSLGLALAAGVRPRRMLIDIDDWESGFFQASASAAGSTWSFRLARTRSYVRRLGLNAFVATRLLEAAARRIPFRTVSNRWLRGRFGGEILYHVRDPSSLDPERAKSPAGVDLPKGRSWVGFVGTPRAHKGLEHLVDALAKLDGQTAPGLLLMGAGRSAGPIVERAQRVLGDRVHVLPPFPFEELGDHLSLADIIAIPSLDVPAAWGQIPAKLFDALAMAKPVIVSNVNDMAEIADGCGITVASANVPDLARAIATLDADPALRERLGQAGRRRFLERYTLAEGRKVLLGVLRAAVS